MPRSAPRIVSISQQKRPDATDHRTWPRTDNLRRHPARHRGGGAFTGMAAGRHMLLPGAPESLDGHHSRHSHDHGSVAVIRKRQTFLSGFLTLIGLGIVIKFPFAVGLLFGFLGGDPKRIFTECDVRKRGECKCRVKCCDDVGGSRSTWKEDHESTQEVLWWK